jgi:serine protease Do
MSRKREFLKLAALIGVAAALSVAFISIVDLPRSSMAQPVATAGLALDTGPAPVATPRPLVDLSEAFVEVAAAAKPSVVYITAEQSQRRRQTERPQLPQMPPGWERFFDLPEQFDPRPRSGQGSGFIISADGYILTNNHVVDEFDRFTVTLSDGRRFTAKVVGADAYTDVAVIKIDGQRLPFVTFGNSDDLREGEWVLAIGSPLGLTFTVTAGIVSAKGRGLTGLLPPDWSIADFIQTDAAINPGNSGGPLVNIRGQVVGINSAIASRTGFYTGYGFAIPANLARVIADQLIKDGKVTRAALGIRISGVTPEDAAYVGLDEVRGVVVEDFASDDSPARRAGLQPGDVIVEVDGQRVDYVAQLQQIVGFKRPGDRVQITVLRQGGERRTYTVRLIEAETNARVTTVANVPAPSESEGAFEAKLGISVEPVSGTVAARLGHDVQGVVVTSVDPDGPSREKLAASNARAGFVEVITHVNGEPVRSQAELRAALAKVAAGEIVSLRVERVARNEAGQVATTRRVERVRVGPID